MEIDDRVESIVREALTAAVKQDSQRLVDAVSALAELPGEDSLTRGAALTAAVAHYVVLDIYAGRPTDEEVQLLAAKIAASEDWTDVSATDISALVTAILNGRKGDEVLSLERILPVSLVAAANLLSSYHRDDEKWWDYLDRAEAAIESAA